VTPQSPPPWRAIAIVLWLAVAACSAVLFVPVIAHGYFLADDFSYIVGLRLWEDQGVLGAKLLSKFAAGIDAGDNHFYRPLSNLTLGLNYLTSGIDPAGWMAVNVALHLGTAVLIAMLGAKLAKTGDPARAAAAGALGATMFLFAAPGAEVVGWISTRFDSTATFFTMGAATAFAFSRRAFDGAWWAAIASGIAALLSKESSATMPFAILAVVFIQVEGAPGTVARVRASLARSSPWLALAVLYLAARWAIFGTATQVYAHSDPLGQAFVAGHWDNVLRELPHWFEGEFPPAQRFHSIVALTLLQLVLIAWARPGSRIAVAGTAAIVAATLALLLPHVEGLAIGVGGRLFYMTIAFYGVLVTVGLCQARLRYLLWGATLGLAIFHFAAMHAALARWDAAYQEMRALATQLQAYGKALPPGEFALVLAQDTYDGLPFGRNAQGGLMLPPLFDAAAAHHTLVQLDLDLPAIGQEVKGGLIGALRENDIFDVLDGKVKAKYGAEYPTRVACWDPLGRNLRPLEVPAAAAAPEAWAGELARAYARSTCSTQVDTRRR
jgi:hypothetical protein